MTQSNPIAPVSGAELQFVLKPKLRLQIQFSLEGHKGEVPGSRFRNNGAKHVASALFKAANAARRVLRAVQSDFAVRNPRE